MSFLQSRRTVSIIVPCYNEERTVGELLNCLRTAFIPFGWEKEIIVVDDASRDGTRNILKRYENEMRIIYCEKNGGEGTAGGRGIPDAVGGDVVI